MNSCQLLIAVLLAFIATVECQCSESEANYSSVVEWKCNKDRLKNVSCWSLGDALNFTAEKAALCHGKINITIYLTSSQETLESDSAIKNVGHFRLIGGLNGTKIECTCGVVLVIEGSGTSTVIENTTFKNCGNGTAALTFLSGRNITLDHVEIANSNGTGLVFQNITGNVSVLNCSFINNVMYESPQSRGAGVHITADKYAVNYTFSHCNFTRNRNIDMKINSMKEIDGGGLYVRVEGVTHNVSVSVYQCHFINNSAKWGAGLFVGFYQSTSNNTVMISNTTFQGNNFHNGTLDTRNIYNAGGGALATTTGNCSLNTVIFQKCHFLENSAIWGGGLALYAAPTKTVDNDKLNKYLVINCSFSRNIAAIGSALNLYCKSVPSAPDFCNAIPYFKGYNVLEENGQQISKTKYPSASTLDINTFSTHIHNSTKLIFRKNAGTPLYLRTTAVVVGENVTIDFINNTAEIGGGIVLYDSWMTLSFGCTFTFTNNSAFGEGGAMYAQQSADVYVPHFHGCFIRFINTSVLPWDWRCKFNFTHNTASTKSNSLYATSITPCEWIDRNNDTTIIFCLKDWYYNGRQNCTDQILTSVRNFSNTSSSVTLSPGIPKTFIIGVDDLGHIVRNLKIIPTLYWSKSKNKPDVQYSDDGLAVLAERSAELSVLIQFDGDRNIFKIVNVSIAGCPPGFMFSNKTKSCMCYENMRNLLQCHGGDWNASLLNGFCMSFSNIDGKNETVYGRCVFSHSQNSKGKYILLPEDENDLNSEYCGSFNRSGLLCGECSKGLCIDAFSITYNCKNSISSAADWITFIAVSALPPFVLFLAILILHINFTSGAMNGFIFFSQVVTLSQEALVVVAIVNMQMNRAQKSFLDSLIDIYSFWSLDNYRIFHSLTDDHPVCLGEKLRVIDVLALHYVSALYPFFLIVIAYIIIELHARNCRVLVWMWKPLCFPCTRFRRSWKLRTSVVDAFASFIILSYVKLIRISLLLVTFTNVTRIGEEHLKVVRRVSNYDPTVVFFSYQHMPFIILGATIVITFGIIPPLLLLFYPCKAVQRFLSFCKINRLSLKTFMDTFQGCYKDGRNGGVDRRFFSGLYLIFRVLIFSIFNLQIDHIITYFSLVIFCLIIICLLAWLQPYKVKFYTNLDIFFTALLAVFFGLHILGFAYLETTLTVPIGVVIGAACISIIPLLYMVGILWLKLLRRCFRIDPVKELVVRVPLLGKQQRIEDGGSDGCMEQSARPSVTYSEVDTRRLVDSTLCESVNLEKDNLLTSRGHESGYGSIN